MPSLCKLYPEEKDLGEGEFTFANRLGTFIKNDSSVHFLRGADVTLVTAYIIRVVGYEQVGYDSKGAAKYILQEWAVRP